MGLLKRLFRARHMSLRRLLTQEERRLLAGFRRAFSPKEELPEMAMVMYFLHERDLLWKEKPVLREIDERYNLSSRAFRIFVDHRKRILNEATYTSITEKNEEQASVPCVTAL